MDDPSKNGPLYLMHRTTERGSRRVNQPIRKAGSKRAETGAEIRMGDPAGRAYMIVHGLAVDWSQCRSSLKV